MIPILYKKSDTNYSRNGAGRLVDVLSCSITEERNGAYECVFTYPISGRLYSEITEGDVIKAKANETSALQLFRIYAHSKPINGIATFNAEHISYDANGIPLAGFSASGTTPQAAITRAISEGAFVSSFTAWSDISSLNNINISEPCSLRALLGGQQGSVLDVWGGEYEFDNYVIKLHQHRGADNGVTIEYGKNLTDVTQERNITETYTHIMPYATYTSETDGDITVTLTEKVLPLTIAENVGHQKALIVNFTDKFSENEPVTEQALRLKAAAFVQNSSLGTPKVNIKASFVSLWQTEEYKSIAPLERVKLCDTVTVRFVKLGVSAKAKVIKTVYDTVAERYISVEIGDVQSSFADTVLEQNKAITELAEVVRKGFSDATAEIQEAIAEATAAITGNSGGYIVLYPSEHPQEILIMDSPSVETAVHVWRWNASGLGYSSTGYNGTYGLAMTMNGAIVADYITTGTLNGGLLRADSVQANAISSGFKQSIADSINNAKTTVEQEFAAADAALASTIYTKTETDALLAGYYTKTETETKIAQSATAIELSVDTKLADYYTKTETDSKFVITSEEIRSEVMEYIVSYDEQSYVIDIRDFGRATESKIASWCEALGTNDIQYLDLLTGKLWSVGRRWDDEGQRWLYYESYPPIQLTINPDCIQSELVQHSNEIAMRVIKGDRTESGQTVNDVITEINASTKGITLSTAGRLVITAGNFQLDANGTATMSNANVSGIVTSGTTSDKMSKLDNGKLLLYANSDFCGMLTGLKTISGQQTRTGIALAASNSLDGIVFGSGSENSDAITGYYWLNTSTNGYNQFNARHYFKDTVRLGNDLYIDGSCTSDLSFANGQGIKLNGYTTVRYSNSKLLIGTTDDTQLQGGTVNIVANDNVNINAGSNKMIYLQKPISVTGSITSSGSCSVGDLSVSGSVTSSGSCSVGGSLSVSGSVTSDLSFSSDNGIRVNGNKVVCYSSSKLIVGNGNETTYIQGYSVQITSSNGTIISSNDDTQISAGTNKAIKMYKYTYFYYGAEIEDSYLTIANGYGIKANGYIAIKYDTSGSYAGFNVGIQSSELHLQGSRVRAYDTIRIEPPYSHSAIKAYGQVNVECSSSSDSAIWVECGGIYVKNGFITLNGSPVTTSSDRRAKNTILPLSEKYMRFIKSVSPVSYKFNDDIAHSGRTHTGFIAQDVLQALKNCGLSTKEFAGFVDLHGDGSEYGLRYEEFISPLLMYVQHLESRVAALEAERTA